MRFKLGLLLGTGLGYTLSTKEGRQRLRELARKAKGAPKRFTGGHMGDVVTIGESGPVPDPFGAAVIETTQSGGG